MRIDSSTIKFITVLMGLLKILDANELNSEMTMPFIQNESLRHCLNLGNALEAPTEGDWGIVLKAEHFQLIKKAGFTAVRVPIRWSSHASENVPYQINISFLDRINWVVNQAIENELAIVINMHHYQDLFSDPQAHRNRYLCLWNQISTYFQDAPNTVLFELLNEPNGKLTSNLWNDLLTECIEIVRKTNPDRTLIVGPANWNHISAELDKLVLPDNNIILTVHYYDPFHFTHQGAEWVNGSDKWIGTSWSNETRQTQKIESDFLRVSDWAQEKKVPVFVGEFGAYNKANLQDRILWTNYVRQQAEKFNFSWAYWEFGAGFGVYDRETKKWRMSLLEALIPKP